MRKSRKNNSRFIVLACLTASSLYMIGASRSGIVAAQAPAKGAEQRPAVVFNKPPVRVLEDANPSFNAIAMDEHGSEVLISNNNKASVPSILVYPAEFKTTDRVMEPKRRIGGSLSRLGDICGLAVSPQNKEIYTVQGEETEMKVFPLDGNGDMEAARSLTVAHGSADIFLEPVHDELFISTEHINKITIYRRAANGDEKPLRFIQGPHTQIADPHGLYADASTNELYVTNYGSYRETKMEEDIESRATDRTEAALPLVDSTGRFVLPSINVYARDANGDIAPIRVIQGPKTGLNLPLGVTRDPATGEIAVANSGGDSVLIFDKGASGDVAPVRIVKGPATNIKAPTGVLIDSKRNELWVTNWENHTTNVYPRSVNGDVKPLRYIRSAPKDSPPATFGTPGAVAWDPKRQEILVPN